MWKEFTALFHENTQSLASTSVRALIGTKIFSFSLKQLLEPFPSIRSDVDELTWRFSSDCLVWQRTKEGVPKVEDKSFQVSSNRQFANWNIDSSSCLIVEPRFYFQPWFALSVA